MSDNEQILLTVLQQVEDEMPSEFKDEFMASKEHELAKYHHNWGRHLRNKLLLWSDSSLNHFFNGMGVWHADDMSGILMTSLWRKMHQQDLKLDEQVESSKKYWAIRQQPLLERIEAMRPKDLRLMCGEMTAQELRTAQAVLGWVARELRREKHANEENP